MSLREVDRLPSLTDHDIVAARGPRNIVDLRVPYAYLVEPERSAAGRVEDVATIFLTNKECPFRCLFCDLWKNTTLERVALGEIPAQIDLALSRLPAARHVKLYNSGNFFDAQAIPPEDYPAIAQRVAGFETVIVENHPKLCGPACVEFRDLLRAAASVPPTLEVAMGLETVHPDILPRLNKRMTLDDFRRAADFLRTNDIELRAFLLLKPPFLKEGECVEWAIRGLEFAFDSGVRVCTVIPTRDGNGAMDRLRLRGEFAPPRLASLEAVLDAGLQMARGRVFVDLWDVERFCDCPHCGPPRAERLRQMNLSQRPRPRVVCDRCGTIEDAGAT